MAKAKTKAKGRITKVGSQQMTVLVVLFVCMFCLFQFKIMPAAAYGFVYYLFQPTGEEFEKLDVVQFDGLCKASCTKDNAQVIIAKGAHDPQADLINKEFIYDFTFKTRTIDANGYAKTSVQWIAKSTTLGDLQIVLEPWVAFWYISLFLSVLCTLIITIFMPTSLGYVAVLFDRQIEATEANIRLQTGFSDNVVKMLTMPDDKFADVDVDAAESVFRTIWARTEGEATIGGTSKVINFDDVFDESSNIVTFRSTFIYQRIKECFSDFVLKEIEDTKNGYAWRRNHFHMFKGLRLYMSHHFTEKYSNMVTGCAYGGAAFLIVVVGIRGLKFIPAAKPSLVLLSTFLEFSMLCLMAFTMVFTEEEERMDKIMKKMEDSNKNSYEALKSQSQDIHQLANVLIGQSAEIIKSRVESAITEYMTSDDNLKRVVAMEISDKILTGMREAFTKEEKQ